MLQPDHTGWRPATGEDLWQWSWQGRGLRRSYAAPLVRILDAEGRTVAEGLALAYDMAEQTIALLGPRHRPGTTIWQLPALPEQIWVETSGG